MVLGNPMGMNCIGGPELVDTKVRFQFMLTISGNPQTGFLSDATHMTLVSACFRQIAKKASQLRARLFHLGPSTLVGKWKTPPCKNPELTVLIPHPCYHSILKVPG